MNTPLLEAALRYAGTGWPVFPCHWPVFRGRAVTCSCGRGDCVEKEKIGKHPRTDNGHLDATTDVVSITRSWRWLPLANIGIPTGERTGVDAIDIDPRHGGDKTLSELEGQYGKLPSTLRARSGSGGEHIFFKHISGVGNSAGKLGPGIDVRGEGGYIVASPSLHMSGRRYEWTAVAAIAEAPAWLAERLAEQRRGSVAPPEKWRALFADGAGEGSRNDAITRMTGHLLARRLDPLMVLDIVRMWNRSRFRPPLDDAEVRSAVNSICGSELRRARR